MFSQYLNLCSSLFSQALNLSFKFPWHCRNYITAENWKKERKKVWNNAACNKLGTDHWCLDSHPTHHEAGVNLNSASDYPERKLLSSKHDTVCHKKGQWTMYIKMGKNSAKETKSKKASDASAGNVFSFLYLARILSSRFTCSSMTSRLALTEVFRMSKQF